MTGQLIVMKLTSCNFVKSYFLACSFLFWRRNQISDSETLYALCSLKIMKGFRWNSQSCLFDRLFDTYGEEDKERRQWPLCGLRSEREPGVAEAEGTVFGGVNALSSNCSCDSQVAQSLPLLHQSLFTLFLTNTSFKVSTWAWDLLHGISILVGANPDSCNIYRPPNNRQKVKIRLTSRGYMHMNLSK